MLRVAIVGYGYWGPNLARNFASCPDTAVAMVCDLSEARLLRAVAQHPTARTTTRFSDVLSSPDVDAVVICTPVATHFALAKAALEHGKHVFVEKPMTASVAEAEALVALAAKTGLVLHVDHTFVYTGAVRRIHELVRAPSFGRLQYYDSSRVNLGIFQHDVNVLWDLAVHDLAIMAYVLGEEPEAVSATGIAHVPGQPENVSFMTLFFPRDLIAHVNVSWLSPVKIRRTLIGGTKQMIVFDDLETSEKVKVYDNGITVTPTDDDRQKHLISYRTGDLWSPKVEATEALAVEAAHFAACVAGRETPLTGGREGLALVRILEAADRSLRQRGAPQPV